MTARLPAQPSLDYLRKQAKTLRRHHGEAIPEARRRVEAAHPSGASAPLEPGALTHAGALRVIAREMGFPSWPALKAHVDALEGRSVFASPTVAELDRRFRIRFPDGVDGVAVRAVLQAESEAVLAAHRSGDGAGVMQIRDWTPRLIGKSAEEILELSLTEDDAKDGVAREHGFTDWAGVERHGAVELDPVFERAVDAVVTGQIEVLEAMLVERPDLARARSSYAHHATLLHYVAANGVETRRQMSPANAADVARTLIAAGAEPDAVCDTYGGGRSQTALCLTVTSAHPAQAGVQGRIVEVLLDAGARVDGLDGDGEPLRFACDFGYLETAELLVRRGARVRDVQTAARLGDVERVIELAGRAERPALEEAFLAGCASGRTGVLDALLAAGVPVDVEGARAGPLHLAAYHGHGPAVRWLLEHGADPRRPDPRWGRTAAEWATQGGHPELAATIEAEP